MESWSGPPILYLHMCDGEALHIPINDTLAQIDPLNIGFLFRNT